MTVHLSYQLQFMLIFSLQVYQPACMSVFTTAILSTVPVSYCTLTFTVTNKKYIKLISSIHVEKLDCMCVVHFHNVPWPCTDICALWMWTQYPNLTAVLPEIIARVLFPCTRKFWPSGIHYHLHAVWFSRRCGALTLLIFLLSQQATGDLCPSILSASFKLMPGSQVGVPHILHARLV